MRRNGSSADQKKPPQDLHGSMRMSAVFGMTPEEEEVGDDDRRHASAPSAGSSMQSSEHLERQLRELHLAQEEMKRREEELKREVQMQKEMERQQRRSSADSGTTRNLTSSRNTSSDIGGVVDMDEAQILEKADEAFDDGRDAMQEMDYGAAKEAFERALSLYRSCPPAAVEKSVRADIHHALGTIELEIGDNYEKSLINLRTARRMRSSIGDKLGEAMSLKDCARLYAKMGQSTNASRSFQECMEIMLAELGEDNPRVHEFFIDIGATARSLGMERDLRDAIAQFQFALDITQSRHDMKPNDLETKLSLCSVLHALGILEYHAGDFQDSLNHLRDLANLRSIIGATPTPQDAAILNVISKIHRKLGNFEMGHEASKKALDKSRQQRKEAARASHSSGRSLGSLQNSHTSEDKSVNVSSGCSTYPSKDPSVYIHLDEQTRVSELESLGPSNALSYQQQTQEMQYIPFILVYDDDHKKEIRRDNLKATMIRLYFKTNKARSEACDILYDVAEMMQFLAADAKQILSSEMASEKQQQEVFENLLFDCDISISMVDEYAPNAYGIVISDRLFWEAFVMPHDFSEFQSDFIGIAGIPAVRSRRQSNPEAQKQNLVPFHSTEHRHPLSSMPCIIQMDDESPVSPQTLVLGVEKSGVGVTPASGETWPPPSTSIPSDAFEGVSIGSFSLGSLGGSIRSRNPDGTIRAQNRPAGA